MGTRSLFVQASTLTESQITSMVTRAKNDPEIKYLALADWDESKASQIKNIVPYNPTGPYKHLYAGNPSPTSQDYRNILDGGWRWANLEAASAAAVQAKPYADGWYISYETGLNVFASEAYRAPWEWYLGDMVRRLRAVKDVPIIWSPYLFGGIDPTAISKWAQTMRTIVGWYSPGAKFEVHVQDGVGAKFQTPSSAIQWVKAMKAANPQVPVKMNVEWFDVLDYSAINAEPREDQYRAAGIDIGFDWEIRYWDAIQSRPATSMDTILAAYIAAVSVQPLAGQAPDNRLHARDTSGRYWTRAQYTSRWGRNLIAQFPGIFSLGQWRSLSVVPTPGSGRDPNSDHYSGGAYDFGGKQDLLEQVAIVVRTDQTVSFARVHGAPLHLHVSLKLEGDLS